MIKDRMTYRWLWSCLIAGGLLLTGCADDNMESFEEPVQEQGSPLELRAVTRTSGATQIGNANCPPIKAILTSETALVQEGYFRYSAGSGWTSDLSVKEERQYYLYGYMPEVITGTTVTYEAPTGGKYADGIDLSFPGLPAITEQDISVVVGVQRVDGVSTETPNVTEGSFSYLSGIWGKNYVNLLMGHIYAGLELNFKIDADYASVRSIHLKTVTLSTDYGKVDATVQLRADKGIEHAVFTKVSGSSASAPITMMSTESAETVLDDRYTNTPLKLNKLAYCFPSIFAAEGANLSITTTYDVYDRTKNKNLGERTSTNKLRITASAINPGQKKTVIITVQPTYLYVLSDGDLDNPGTTVVIN
ncbi:MAG: hypothetical protein IKD75_12030 [Prevotella sp.]|nr:hypothetical protein [Prevotella sp.]